jgi:hypothetical protein
MKINNISLFLDTLRSNVVLETMLDTNFFKTITENNPEKEAITAMTGHIVTKTTAIRLMDILLSTEVDIPQRLRFQIADINTGETILQYLHRKCDTGAQKTRKMQNILNSLTADIGQNIISKNGWQTFQNRIGFRGRQVEHIIFLVDKNFKKSNLEEIQNAVILAKITEMCYSAITNPKKCLEKFPIMANCVKLITEIWIHRGTNQFNLNEKFEKTIDLNLDRNLDMLTKNMIVKPDLKFEELNTAIIDMKKSGNIASKKEALDKLFVAMNRKSENTESNIGDIRKWILGSKTFNNPEQNRAIEDLREILRIKSYAIENGRDLKINKDICLTGFRDLKEIAIGGQKEFWDKIKIDMDENQLIDFTGENIKILEDKKLFGKILILQTIENGSLEERIENLTNLDNTPGSLSEIMKKYRENTGRLNICGIENNGGEICLNITKNGPCNGHTYAIITNEKCRDNDFMIKFQKEIYIMRPRKGGSTNTPVAKMIFEKTPGKILEQEIQFVYKGFEIFKECGEMGLTRDTFSKRFEDKIAEITGNLNDRPWLEIFQEINQIFQMRINGVYREGLKITLDEIKTELDQFRISTRKQGTKTLGDTKNWPKYIKIDNEANDRKSNFNQFGKHRGQIAPTDANTPHYPTLTMGHADPAYFGPTLEINKAIKFAIIISYETFIDKPGQTFYKQPSVLNKGFETGQKTSHIVGIIDVEDPENPRQIDTKTFVNSENFKNFCKSENLPNKNPGDLEDTLNLIFYTIGARNSRNDNATELEREKSKYTINESDYRSAAILNLCRKDIQLLLEANNALYNFKINIGVVFGQKASGGKMLRGLNLGTYQVPNAYRNLGVKEYIIPRNVDISGKMLEESKTEQIGQDAKIPTVMIGFERQQGVLPSANITGEPQTCRLANVAVLKKNIGKNRGQNHTHLIEYIVPSERLATPTTANELAKLNPKILPYKCTGGKNRIIYTTQISKNCSDTVIADFTNTSLNHASIADCVSKQLNGETTHNSGQIESLQLANRENKAGYAPKVFVEKRQGQSIELPTLRQGVIQIKNTTSLEKIGKFMAETAYNWESGQPKLSETNSLTKAFNFKLSDSQKIITDTITPGNLIMTDFEDDKGIKFSELPTEKIRKDSKIRQEKFANKERLPRDPQFSGPRPAKLKIANAYGGENVLEQIRPNVEIIENSTIQDQATKCRKNTLEDLQKTSAEAILQNSLRKMKITFEDTKNRIKNNIKNVESEDLQVPAHLLNDKKLCDELTGVTNFKEFQNVVDKLNVATVLTPGQLFKYAEHYEMANRDILEDFAQKYWGNALPGK